MLNQINLSRKSTADDATTLLLGCHERIRHFSSVAVKLAHAQGASPADTVEAANALLRYFTVALPLHEADENISLHPRIRKAAPVGDLGGPAVDAMVEQHEHIDIIVERLVPLWTLVKSSPDKLEELAGEMCGLTSRLSELFTAHLELEESTVFPAMARLLTEAELQTIVQEMKSRRQA